MKPPPPQRASSKTAAADDPELAPAQRRRIALHLREWYGEHARALPWRGIRDPFRTWVSEIMLQQTRVNAVLEHYARFLRRFPTVVSLALAPEDEVLALWSGLGYYRRARMLHRTAKLVMQQYGGQLPSTAAGLRCLPGIGAYTSAAIASIAFGERVAVVDGNVERVLLRVLGRPEATGAAAAEWMERTAQSLVPADNPGDHNQAVMELGATICLPRNPLCTQCPIVSDCLTRGEHITQKRAAMRSERVQYALTTRKAGDGAAVDVLLQKRPADASLMPGMLELPRLASDDQAEPGRLTLEEPPLLRVRHAIVGTNYYVEVFGIPTRQETEAQADRSDSLEWHSTRSLTSVPLTGLARKVLQRLRLMRVSGSDEGSELPLWVGRGGTARSGDSA